MNEPDRHAGEAPEDTPRDGGMSEDTSRGGGVSPRHAPASHRPLLTVEDGRSYYMYTQGTLGSRKQRHGNAARPVRRVMPALAVLIGLGGAACAIFGLANGLFVGEDAAAGEGGWSAWRQAALDLGEAAGIGFTRLLEGIREAFR